MKPDKYQHYKGGTYKVITLAKSRETMEEMVIYESLEHPGEVWMRPVEEFFEKIEREGKMVNRFEKIEDEK
jgi:hypothetical protein